MLDTTEEQIMRWISEKVADVTDIDVSELDLDKNILDYGIDSLRSIRLIDEIETRIGKQIPVTSIIDHPTICRLAKFVHKQVVIE